MFVNKEGNFFLLKRKQLYSSVYIVEVLAIWGIIFVLLYLEVD